jgi:hypothetical protein
VPIMSIPLPVLLIFGAALCGWALLRCIGNECDRRLRVLEDRVRAEHAVKVALAAAKEASSAATPIVGSSMPKGPAKTAAGKPAAGRT